MAATRKRSRAGELTCNCDAYPFPHMFGGGRCIGKWLVTEQWESCYGIGACAECNSLGKENGLAYCEVYEGIESVHVCPVWQDFVLGNEIKYPRRVVTKI